MSTGVFTKAVTPQPILSLGLTKKMRDTNVAFKELGVRRSIPALQRDVLMSVIIGLHAGHDQRPAQRREERGGG
jgi:hypothetical protein